jgi:hypothetical protein
MAAFGFLRQNDNLLLTAAVTSSSAAEGFPASNLKQPPISRPWRTVGLSSQWFEADFGSAKQVNFVVLANHNLTSAATITITSGSSPAPAGNSEVITWTKFNAYRIMSINFRYVRVTITDAANPDGFIQLGLAMAGWEPLKDYSFAYGWEKERAFRNRENFTDFGVDHTTELYDEWIIRMVFQNRTTAQMDELAAIYESLQGARRKLFLVPDPDAVQEGFFGRIVNTFLRRYDYYHTAEIIFRSDSRGKAIGA